MSASLVVWRLEEAPGSDEVATAARVLKRAPDEVIQVEDLYARSLEAGVFLVCTEATPHSCAALNVREGQLWTVHVNHPGSVLAPSLKVFRPDGTADPDAPFQVEANAGPESVATSPADSGTGELDAGTQWGPAAEPGDSDDVTEPVAATSSCEPPEPFTGDLSKLSEAEASAVARFGATTAPYDHRPVARSCFAKGTQSCPDQPDVLCGGAYGRRPFAHCDQNINLCFADECHCDADCGSGQACLCPDQPGSSYNHAYCVLASCRVDADCEGDLRCVLAPGAKCPVVSVGFHCESTTGECRTDADCETQGGGVCAYDGADWVCSTVRCTVP